jgi:hypothetical protein
MVRWQYLVWKHTFAAACSLASACQRCPRRRPWAASAIAAPISPRLNASRRPRSQLRWSPKHALHVLQVVAEVPQQIALLRYGGAHLMFRDADGSGREQASYYSRHGCRGSQWLSQGLYRMPCADVQRAMFIRLIIRLFQLIFSVETVFFSHNKSANRVFQSAYQHSRMGPYMQE